MKDRIKEMLERGERVELECVDRDGFEGLFSDNKKILQLSEIIIAGYDEVGKGFDLAVGSYELNNLNLRISNAFICDSELEHFKIKEPEYTFNDLIDVAVQAVKDGVIDIKTLCMDSIRFTPRDETDNVATYFDDEYAYGFDYIKSLYTETFVIESKEDMYRIGDEYEIVLSNGEDVSEMIIVTENYPYTSYGDRLIPVRFEFLKGATVTQKRGNQCNK